MKPRPFIRKLPPKAATGFTLIELLVTLFVTSILMMMMTGFFQANVGTRHDMNLRTEAQQGVRALLEMVTQELRQAGACLPPLGRFIALEGTDNGQLDHFILRIGRTAEDTLVCVRAGTTEFAAQGSTTLTVLNGVGDLFANADVVYITPNAANGAFYTVAATSGTTITLNEPLDADHPAGSGIYAVDEREYEVIDDVLTVSLDRSVPYPLVTGVTEFNITYHLAPCDVGGCAAEVNEPLNDAEWRLVREVTISATVEAHNRNRDGTVAFEEGEVNVKPRNLL